MSGEKAKVSPKMGVKRAKKGLERSFRGDEEMFGRCLW
jgi:hypothetical protein